MTADDPTAPRTLHPPVATRARELATRDGQPSFPVQDQDPPGWTASMRPVPDHGEETYVGHGRLEGLSTLITGADSGIGRAVAIAFAREGADIALSYLPEEQEDAEEAARWVREAGRRALLLPGDIQDEQVARSLVTRTVEEFGRLDVLVNNAGRRHAGLIADTPVDEITEVFAINTLAAMAMTSAAVAPMTAQGEGVVINVLSRLATVGVATLTTYSASKGALLAYTRGAAVELAPHGIRVNAVAPGMTTTPLIEDWLSDQEDSEGTLQSVVSQIPLGRLGNPDDTSAAVAYLASPEASYLTGVSIPIDGGYTAQ